jgi:3-phytase
VADDPAIWRDDRHPERSLVLGDDKSDPGGVAIYDLGGKIVHYEQTGRIGNIDLRDGYRLGDRTVILVGANDRSGDRIRLWALDPDARSLTSLEAHKLHSISENYGFCLGRSKNGKQMYAFVSQENTGKMEQYELIDVDGKLDAKMVRAFAVGSQAEGCVVDDATGSLYVAEENVAIWRYDVDPGTGTDRDRIDKVGDGHLTADIEGISTTRGGDGHGVLVASSQGDSTFAVYDLDSHAYRGSFRVQRSGDVDGVSETDGLAVAAGDFGPDFPNGLLVMHDGENHKDDQDERVSDFKLVRLDRVVALIPLAQPAG